MKLSEVFKALEDGLEVECRIGHNDEWVKFDQTSFMHGEPYHAGKFRIKSKLHEYWVNIYDNDCVCTLHRTLQEALYESNQNVRRTIKMREVVDE